MRRTQWLSSGRGRLAAVAGLMAASMICAAAQVTVVGRVIIHGSRTGKPIRDASQAAIWLVPLQRRPIRLASRQVYRMVQHHKSFNPTLLVVPLGSEVSFPNLDPWYHNVFSLYRGQRFDLGLFEGGSARQVRFDRLGASFLFCNIHPQMAAVILTVPTRYFAVSNPQGGFRIAKVPPGAYILHVWYEYSSALQLRRLRRRIEIRGSLLRLPALALARRRQPKMPHKNLFGRNYTQTGRIY